MPAGTQAQGYPDWTHAVTWDGVLLYALPLLARTAGVTSGRINVSRWQSISLFTFMGTPSARGARITLIWFGKPAGGNARAEREINLAPFGENPEHLALTARLPNYGPYLEVIVEGQGAGANWTLEMEVAGDNRPSPAETTAHLPLLIPRTAEALEAGHEAIILPRYYYAGQVSFSLYRSAAPFGYEVQPYYEGAWHEGVRWRPQAGEGDDVVTMPVPLGAWRLRVINQAAGASTFDVRAAPFVSGGE